MKELSKMCELVPKSAIREMFAMQEGMDDVVSFALGEPDFDAPKHVVSAVIDSYKRNETHYTPNNGIYELRNEISKSYGLRGMDYSPEEVLVTPGAISALNLTALVLLEAGDEIIIPDPGWSNYKGLMIQVGAVPVPVRLREENGFMYDPKEVAAAITDKTKAILINSPSNPTGGVMSKAVLKELAELAEGKDLYVITDEIYRKLIYSDEEYTSIAEFEGMKERTIIIDGFSKSYAMTGIRVGYAVGPTKYLEIMNTLLENIFSCMNECVQWGGVAALTGDQSVVDDMRRIYMEKRKLVVDGLNSIDKISCIEPKGAFYAFVNISKTGLTSKEFAMKLLKEKHCVVIPGDGFGEGGEGFVRISYATSKRNIVNGINRIKEFVETL